MSTKTKILYLSDDFWSTVGGTEQNLLWLLQQVPDDEFEKHFIVFSSVRFCDPNSLPLVPRRLAEEFGFGWKTWPRRIRVLAKILKERRIDVIHAFSQSGELAAVLAARLAGRVTTEHRSNFLPVIGNRRDIGYHWTWKGRLLSRLVQRFNIRYIANSEAARQAAHRIEGIAPNRITVIRNPISEERIQAGWEFPLRRENVANNLPDDAVLIGMVATVRPIKDHPTLFRAAKTVLQRYPNVFLVLIGETIPASYRQELEVLVEELGIGHRVIWFGPLDNPYRILPLFDVAVLSSHSESFSNAVLEYAVSGRAIVVSDVGGLREIIHQNETGLLVPPSHPDELAAALLRLLDDPQLRETLGTSVRECVLQEFSEAKILDLYLDLYRSTQKT